MIRLGFIAGPRMSAIGPKTGCRGSKMPHDGSSLVVPGDGFSEDGDLREGVASPFLRFPLVFGLEPLVPARGREVTPVLRALTSSSQ